MLAGDYTLRDSAGGTKGIVRLALKWKYPFQLAKTPQYHREREHPEGEIPRVKKRELVDKGRDTTPRPIAKPRLKVNVLNSNNIIYLTELIILDIPVRVDMLN